MSDYARRLAAAREAAGIDYGDVAAALDISFPAAVDLERRQGRRRREWTWRYAPPRKALATHGTVTFKSGGTMTWSQGGGGTWEHSGRTVTLDWSKGSVDHLTLTADGRRMTGTNNQGWSVEGTKK